MVPEGPSAKDRALLEQIQQGDEQAIARLYDRHSTLVYSVAMRLLADAALAEQMVSDILLQVWRYPKRFLLRAANLSPVMAIIAPNRARELQLDQAPSNPGFFSDLTRTTHRQQAAAREQAQGALDRLPVGRRKMLQSAFFPRKGTDAI